MTTTQTRWQLAGDYFENCNCKVVCPCLLSTTQPLTSRPTEGACEVAFAFHINSGSYDNITLDGLNVAMIARTPGPMAEVNWSVALYLDERANEQRRQALQAIFSGSAGGPLGALAPLISTVLGAKTVPITFNVTGKRRSVEIPNIMHLAVHPLPSLDPNNEIWALHQPQQCTDFSLLLHRSPLDQRFDNASGFTVSQAFVSCSVQFMAQHRRGQANRFGQVLLCFIQQMTVEAYLLAEVVHLHFRS